MLWGEQEADGKLLGAREATEHHIINKAVGILLQLKLLVTAGSFERPDSHIHTHARSHALEGL